MEIIEKFKGKIIALDTAPFIYFFEDNPHYIDFLKLFFESHSKGDFYLVTSPITLLEVLVQPLRLGRQEIALEYRRVLSNTKGLNLVPIREAISVRAAELRAEYSLRTPDALQIATAQISGADYFLTNDLDLNRVRSIPIICLSTMNKPER